MKPHDSKIESPSGLSWDTASFVLAAPGLGGFPLLPPAVGGMVHHLGAVGPCQDAQFAVALLTAAVEGRAEAVHGERGCSSDFCLGCNHRDHGQVQCVQGRGHRVARNWNSTSSGAILPAPAVCSSSKLYVSVTSFTYTFIQQIFIQYCSVPGGRPGAGDAGVSVYRVRKSISGENDEKEAGMGRSRERAFQAERTGKALR